jgi:DAHP synthase ferredoxin-like domain
MLIVMKKTVTEDLLQQVKEYLIDRDFDFHQSTGANRMIIGVIGDTDRLTLDEMQKLPGVQQVFKISEDE